MILKLEIGNWKIEIGNSELMEKPLSEQVPLVRLECEMGKGVRGMIKNLNH